jgi:mono/diheme cytochrome c family protein
MDRPSLIIGTLYLLSLTVLSAHGEESSDAVAHKLINSQGCKACHALEGDGGTLAANFETLRAKLSRATIRLQLVNPAQTHGKGMIPDFSHLSKEQIDALVNFIQPEP